MEPFIGQIQLFGFNFAPQGWAFCQGQLLAISSNTAMFSLLGTIYGGDGRTTFGLPDLRGRVPIGPGNGPGLPSYSLGQKGGQYSITQNINTLANHNHTGTVSMAVSSATGEEITPVGNVMAVHAGAFNEDADASAASSALTTNPAGGNQAISIQNPYVAIYYSIAIFGIYPSRS